MRFRPLLAGAAALALALSLAACGDDGDDDATDTTEAETETDETGTDETGTDDTGGDDPADDTTEPEDPASTDDTEAEGDDPAGEEGGDDLSGLLLTPEDVDDGFVAGPYTESTEPTPCGADTDAEHPYDTVVGTVLADQERGLFLQHELRSYADEAAAGAAFAAAQDGFSCGADTTDERLELGEVTDVSGDVGADTFLVPVTAQDGEQALDGGLIVAQIGAVLSVYTLQGPAEVDDGPDALAIVAANVEALQAELG